MSKQIITILKKRFKDLAGYDNLDAETQRNVLKEELQYYVLNFIYHHPEYRSWTMYGGSALRIIYGLDRMSVDLDFEINHAITNKFLEKLKKEVKEYFFTFYNADRDFFTIKVVSGRGLLLKFHIGEEFDINHPSKQVYVKIDLNYFVAPNVVTDSQPINHNQLSFTIKTYNISTLMASKLAAIFLRGTRGVGKDIFKEKGRDIYDLLWYMGKKIIPDFDYLVAKKVDIKDPRTLFDKLTIKVNEVSDKNLEQDLRQLFIDKVFIINWIMNWRETYLRLLEDYGINIITNLENVDVIYSSGWSRYSFVYSYKAEEDKTVKIIYNIDEDWIDPRDVDSSIKINNKIIQLTKGTFEGKTGEVLKQYVTLFYEKTEDYFKKMNKVIVGNIIETKFVRMRANGFNPQKDILLNKSALLACELDDLLR